MANRKHVNENYIHSCDGEQLNPDDYICSVLDMGFSDLKTIELLRFYLFNPAVLKSDAKTRRYGQKSLRDYEWVGSRDMNRLEGRLLIASGIQMFCFIKCDSIVQTLESMNLKPGVRICVEHPRAVIQQKAIAAAREDGSIVNGAKETRMECLFRHLRNSFAHNCTYLFPNGNVLIEDCSEDGKSISARILIPREALVRWATTVEAGPDGKV